MTTRTARGHGTDALEADIQQLGNLLGDLIAELSGSDALELVRSLRDRGIRLREGDGKRSELAAELRGLDLESIEQVARAFTHWFHLVNAAEEQHRIRVLRRRDASGEIVVDSINAAFAELTHRGASAADVRAMLGRLFIMPVVTAHPTEARRRTVLDHLGVITTSLDKLDCFGRFAGGDGKAGKTDKTDEARESQRLVHTLRSAIGALYCTEEKRATKPSPIDELNSSMHVFERTLLEVTPKVYRELERSLATAYPGESFDVPDFLRWGSWIGGDRDGNPFVTSHTTRTVFERQRAVVLGRYVRDAEALLRTLSVSARRVSDGRGLSLLEASLVRDRERFPVVAAQAARYTVHEPWREKLWHVRARLQATLSRDDSAYPRVSSYLDDLHVLRDSLVACGFGWLADGLLRDCIRRARVFGFHLASLDIRQHSGVHEKAVAELLEAGGVSGYGQRDDSDRIALLSGLLERADLSSPVDRDKISPATRELLGTLDMVGRARREMGPAACERYVVSFTSSVSDLLEVLFLSRAARLAPTELRPVPLLEQLEDLENCGPIAESMLDIAPVRAALGGELEVMIGYSDAGKQIGYFASAAALRRAQATLAQVAKERDVTLTIFHGRGGAIGRGGGPASRAIRAQPPEALAGRIRVTEQGETVTHRYGRAEIAQRDLEQLVSAVVVASTATAEHDDVSAEERAARVALLDNAATRAQQRYAELLEDRDLLASYAIQATPIHYVGKLNIGSRPASRKPGFSFEDLRAIPWVFSWNQSRHGIPGWFGLGTALDCIVEEAGLERARALYRDWPFFRAVINNAQMALSRADIEVAAEYAELAEEAPRRIFELIRGEHRRTVDRVLEVVDRQELLGYRPHLLAAVKRRNPYVDVLSHAQIELMRRLSTVPEGPQANALRSALFITINGIAAGLQTAG